MNDQSGHPEEPRPSNRGDQAVIRFEATVHSGASGRQLEGVADLDLDRVPDPDGGIRVLVTAKDCVGLIESGYEVHLHAAVPVRPLSADWVQTDESVRDWLEERVQGIERAGGS